METLIPIKDIKVPSDLGFNEHKFPEYRNGQLESAQKAAQSDKILFLAELPTGVGKSLMGLTAAKLGSFSHSAYVVSTKQLQAQIENDFHIPVLMGRANYPCLAFPKLFPDVSSEICKEYKGEDDCEFEDDCPYLIHKRKALAAPVCVLNYPLYLTEVNFAKAFKGLDYLILDEVDSLENHLMSFVEVKVSEYILDRFNLGQPQYKTKPESWKEWAVQATSKMDSHVKKVDPKWIANPHNMKSWVRIKRAHNKIRFLSESLDDSWVMEDEKDNKGYEHVTSLAFKPVKVAGFAKSNLWQHATRALGMSATIIGPAAMAIDLGLKSWDIDYMSLPSPFPIESRIINYCPVADVTFKNKEDAYPKLAEAVNKILKKHPNDKTLIHAVSYELTKYIVSKIQSNSHTVMYHDSINRAEVLEKFKSYPTPAVLVSPSMERGIDLPGDMCRIVLVLKMPFKSLKDPQVNKRLHGFADGNLWYARNTIRSLVQMTGRATRFLGDWSICYILDLRFGHLVAEHGALFPEWWKSACKYLDPHEL